MENDSIKVKVAMAALRDIGHSYAVKMAELGHNLDGHSDLMNGLAAYYKLDLRGEADYLDKSVDIICEIVYEVVLGPSGACEEKLKQESHDGK